MLNMKISFEKVKVKLLKSIPNTSSAGRYLQEYHFLRANMKFSLYNLFIINISSMPLSIGNKDWQNNFAVSKTINHDLAQPYILQHIYNQPSQTLAENKKWKKRWQVYEKHKPVKTSFRYLVHRLPCISAAFCSWNLCPTRSLCFKNFSTHRVIHVSSLLLIALEVKSLTQSVKHRSTNEEYN